jgi:hypothetical protein
MNNHLKSISPLTLANILAWQFVGNAYSDGPAFASIANFANDDTQSFADRAAAIRYMGEAGMGLDADELGSQETDEQFVKSYLA